MSAKALFFDVFSTLVDWRSSALAREAEAILKPLGHALDWLAFADAWRDEYQPGMEEVRSGRIPFSSLIASTASTSSASCRASASPGTPDAVLRELNLAWHRLDACGDAEPGLARLQRGF